LAKMRAMVVLPVPRGPQKKISMRDALLLDGMVSVCVTCSWPTTSANRCGRYFLAIT